MNERISLLFVILSFLVQSCTLSPKQDQNGNAILAELGVFSTYSSQTACSSSPPNQAFVKELQEVSIVCPPGFRIMEPKLDNQLKYTSLSSIDTLRKQDFEFIRVSDHQIKVRANRNMLAGEWILTLKEIYNRDSLLLPETIWKVNVDTLSPNLTASYPSGSYDPSIFFTNQFDLRFDELVSGIDELSNYKVETNSGSVTIRNIAKLSEQSIRIFWQGDFPRSGGTLRLSYLGIKDRSGNEIKGELNYRIFGWKDGPNVQNGKRDFAIANLSNGDSLLIGGLGVIKNTSSTSTLSIVERWNVNLGTITEVSPLNQTRRFSSFAQTNEDRIVLSGGFTTNLSSSITNTTAIYRPDTGTWNAGPNLSTARIGHASCAISSNKILITGGRTTNLGSAVSTAEILTLDSIGGGSIQTISNLPNARMNHQCIRLANGMYWIVGGSTTTTEIFNPTTESFTTGPSLVFPQELFTSQFDLNGDPFLIGGRSGSLVTDIVQKLNQSNMTVSVSTYLFQARMEHASARLPDRNFISVGGIASATGSVLSSTEKQWNRSGIDSYVLPATKQGRRGHRLLNLVDGRLLLVGGISGVGVPDYLTSTEVFGD
ncbi:hypothetical protein LPTSP4_19950 [Leptospira ryugenii]|uniref:Kelch repeat protein n=1 Tax=Leptospira ryugenii TaxID=1917863 RepID=A0A2P2E0Q4_9LEPT|nr:kelch repeat-containing protein [Leptospira ryugenii]GBF50470.1 hypothetical protein LPTSP4_19950 [Leptospira ryugenii]